MNNPIVFFDSGIGGLPYLTHLREILPQENLIYIADNKNFPYGEKSKDHLIKIITSITDLIINRFNPKAIVVACNTASVTALNDIRSLSNIPIIGVVPAIKTAASMTKNNKIGVLATKRTVNGEYIKKLITEFSYDKDVYSVGASGIVEFVEKSLFFSSTKSVQKYITESVKELKRIGVDCVVLGCTHFIYVSEEINRALGPQVKVIDSRDGVSNQVKRVLSGVLRDSPNPSYSDFYNTSTQENDRNYLEICRSFKLNFRGEL